MAQNQLILLPHPSQSPDLNPDVPSLEDVPLEVTAYLASMDMSNTVHFRNNDFLSGQVALLKADFDNNQKTRKRKLVGFYDCQVEVIQCLQNNRIKVKKLPAHYF